MFMGSLAAKKNTSHAWMHLNYKETNFGFMGWYGPVFSGPTEKLIKDHGGHYCVLFISGLFFSEITT